MPARPAFSSGTRMHWLPGAARPGPAAPAAPPLALPAAWQPARVPAPSAAENAPERRCWTRRAPPVRWIAGRRPPRGRPARWHGLRAARHSAVLAASRRLAADRPSGPTTARPRIPFFSDLHSCATCTRSWTAPVQSEHRGKTTTRKVTTACLPGFPARAGPVQKWLHAP